MIKSEVSQNYSRKDAIKRVDLIVSAFDNGASSINEALLKAGVSYTFFARAIEKAKQGEDGYALLLKTAGPHIGQRGRKKDPKNLKSAESLKAERDEALEKLESKRIVIENKYLAAVRQLNAPKDSALFQ